MKHYNYTAAVLRQPSAQDIEAARAQVGLTQLEAAALVHRHDSARWRDWASGRHAMDLAAWELFLIKADLRAVEKSKTPT